MTRAKRRVVRAWHSRALLRAPCPWSPPSENPTNAVVPVRLVAVFQAEQVEQAADVVAVLGGVAKHRGVVIDHVAVAAATALPFHVAGFDEFGHDSLRGSERDPDL